MTTATRARRGRPGIDLATVRGRARADRWPLLVALLVVTLTAVLAVLTPRLVDRTADESVREAVARAGAGADTVLSVPLRPDFAGEGPDRDPAAGTVDLVPDLTAALPPELAAVLAPPVAAVLTRPLRLTLPAATTLPPTDLRLAWVWAGRPPAVSWVAGGAPGDGTQVALSAEVAAAIGVQVGERLPAQGPSADVDLTVSGVFRPVDATDPVWSRVPEAVRPRVSGAGPQAHADATALLSDAGLADVRRTTADDDQLFRTVTYAARADRFSAADLAPVARAVARLRTAGGAFPVAPAPRVDSRLGTVLLDAQARLRAAQAQAPVLLTAVVVTAALALLLTGQLLVQRRAAVLATTRARGGSLAGTAVELALESAALALLGAGVGLLAAGFLAPGRTPWSLLAVVVVVAAGTTPVLGVRQAARATGGRRVPADRRRRRALRRDRQVRRAAIEAAAVLLAVAALLALRLRGVLASAASPGGDLLLAAAPTLAVLAGAVVLFRLSPLLTRLGLRWARRSRSAVPLLAAARVQAATRALPVLALTAATGLAVLAVVLGATVRAGQVDASWAAVGADVTVTTPDPDPGLGSTADRLADLPGVELAVPARVEDGVQLLAASGGDRATVLVVDPAAFARLLASTPLPDGPDLGRLTGDGPHALVSADLPVRAAGTSVLWNGEQVPFTAVGRVPALGPDRGTTVVLATGSVPADLAVPDTVWVVGDRAAAAVAATPELTGAQVTDRQDRLAAERAAPLTTGLDRLVAGSAVVLTALAVLVVVLTAQTGGPGRRHLLATVRTLGLTGRQVRRVSAGELLPVVLLSTVGGAVLGVAVAGLVRTPLELQLVTGGTGTPALVVPWWTPAVVLPLLLTVGVVVALESALRRRERLGEVLRVGGQSSG